MDLGATSESVSATDEVGTQTEFISYVSVSTQTINITDIEIIDDTASKSSTPLKQSAFQKVFNEDKVQDPNLSNSFMVSTSNSESDSISSEDDCLIINNRSENSMINNCVDASMYLVEANHLELLFKKCLGNPFCNAPISDISKTFQGSLVSYNITCSQNHFYSWQSQPTVNRTALGNVLLAAGTLYSGNTFKTLSEIAECSGIKLFSEKTFYEIQNSLLYPTVNSMWKAHQLELHTGIFVE